MPAKLNEMELRIAARLNEEIGKDVNRLHRAALLVEKYKERLHALNQTVSMPKDMQGNNHHHISLAAQLRGPTECVQLQNGVSLPAAGL